MGRGPFGSMDQTTTIAKTVDPRDGKTAMTAYEGRNCAPAHPVRLMRNKKFEHAVGEVLRMTGAAVLTGALCLASGCDRFHGKTSTAPASVNLQEASGSVAIRSSRGTNIGRLRLVDPFPCYELRYEGDYRLEDLSKPVASASTGKAQEGFACTCFSGGLSGGGRVFGRNFDWTQNPALVLLTHPKGGYASVSLVDISYLGFSGSRKPFDAPDGLEGAWRIPFDGMNEKGFAVGMMAVDHAEGPAGTGKPKVGELGLLRILLDRAANVREAIELMKAYEVDLGAPPIHYFLTDRAGDTAVAEFVGGQLRVIRNDAPWMVSTNFILSEVPLSARNGVCWRYAKVTARMQETGGCLDANGAIDILSSVSVPSTRWSAIYNLESQSLTLALAHQFKQTYRWSLN